MTMVFKDYAKVYDLIYAYKDYAKEASLIIDMIKEKAPFAKTVLNIGCGTGKHDRYFSEAGYHLTGVDFSSEMIEIAKKNAAPNCTYLRSDARSLNISKKFDVIISIFHVFSYQTTNADAAAFLTNVSEALADEKSIALFDYWYGPAVLTIGPEERTKDFDSVDVVVQRKTKTVMNYLDNVGNVEIKIDVLDKKTSERYSISEVHPMRYFFTPELSLFFEKAGLKQLRQCAWPSATEKPGERSWSAYSIVKKI